MGGIIRYKDQSLETDEGKKIVFEHDAIQIYHRGKSGKFVLDSQYIKKDWEIKVDGHKIYIQKSTKKRQIIPLGESKSALTIAQSINNDLYRISDDTIIGYSEKTIDVGKKRICFENGSINVYIKNGKQLGALIASYKKNEYTLTYHNTSVVLEHQNGENIILGCSNDAKKIVACLKRPPKKQTAYPKDFRPLWL